MLQKRVCVYYKRHEVSPRCEVRTPVRLTLPHLISTSQENYDFSYDQELEVKTDVDGRELHEKQQYDNILGELVLSSKRMLVGRRFHGKQKFAFHREICVHGEGQCCCGEYLLRSLSSRSVLNKSTVGCGWRLALLHLHKWEQFHLLYYELPKGSILYLLLEADNHILILKIGGCCSLLLPYRHNLFTH